MFWESPCPSPSTRVNKVCPRDLLKTMTVRLEVGHFVHDDDERFTNI